jgi:hypothetical protein
MRLILITLLSLFISSCTTNQRLASKIEENNRVLQERAEGARKISEARSNTNAHRIMEINIPVPKEKPEKVAPLEVKKEEPDIFDVEPKGLVKRGSNGR